MPARRALLSLVGATLAGVAGCSGGSRSNGSTPTDSPTATVAPAYNIELDNQFTPSAYTYAHDEDATATIHVTVEKVIDPDSLESEVMFERRVEVDAPTTRSWEDAFTPDPDAAEFVLSARYKPDSDEVPVRDSMSDTFRFAAGSYSTPDTATFTVEVVADHPSPSLTQPKVSIEA